MSLPLVRFVIGGAQKAGTTTLAQLLAQHPALALPRHKEAHVFDAPDFVEGATTDVIDERYSPHFDAGSSGRLHGDATPIYLMHPVLVSRIAAYNPAMRWIVLLRDPVERALSHHAMERARGLESLPAWRALLAEPGRLRAHGENWRTDSPLRCWSYRRRSDYLPQLDILFGHFPRSQVLVLHTDALEGDQASILARVCEFLEVPPPATPPAPVHANRGERRESALDRAVARWLLRQQQRDYDKLREVYP